MKRLNLKKSLSLALIVAGAMVATSASAAVSISQIATNMSSGFSSVGAAVESFCWVMALITGAGSAFKFAAYARDTDREKISTPFLLLFVAALFFAIPMVIDTGVASVWGSATVKESAHGNGVLGN